MGRFAKIRKENASDYPRAYRDREERRVSLPGGKILINARAELLELAISSGLQVMEAMFKEDVEAIFGPRYCHLMDRDASRWGRTRPTEWVPRR